MFYAYVFVKIGGTSLGNIENDLLRILDKTGQLLEEVAIGPIIAISTTNQTNQQKTHWWDVVSADEHGYYYIKSKIVDERDGHEISRMFRLKVGTTAVAHEVPVGTVGHDGNIYQLNKNEDVGFIVHRWTKSQ